MSDKRWDAVGYDREYSFVTSLGADLLDLLHAQKGERILDIGCGTGHQAAQLAAMGAQVVGVDADESMIASARAEYEDVKDLRFVHGDAQILAVAVAREAPFDAVVSNAALHWMPDQDAVAAGVAAVLRPGGRAVVEMGGAGCVARVLAAIAAARAALGLPTLAGPHTFPTVAEQVSRWEHAGFVLRYVRFFDRMTPLAAGSTTAGWAQMFGGVLVNDVPADRRADFDDAIDRHAAAAGLDRRLDGEPGWWADYVRLRFVAERLRS